MASKPRVGSGNIAVLLGDQEYQLVPTPSAMQGVSRQAGGLRAATDSVMALDVDVISRILQLGLGPTVVKELGGSAKFPDLIFNAGLMDSTPGALAEKCISYLTILSNGGRPVNPGDDDTADEGDAKDPPV